MKGNGNRWHVWLWSAVLLLPIWPASAYQVSQTTGGLEIKWASPGITYLVNSGLAPANFPTALSNAVATWNGVSGSRFRYAFGGPTASHSYGVSDSVNIVDFGPLGSGIVAQNTFWYNSSNGNMLDSDVRFSTSLSWSTTLESGKYDVQNVATHEFGHTLSLDDLYGALDTEKTMYGYSSPLETKRRTLEPDDEDGIRYLYPVDSSVAEAVFNGGSDITTQDCTMVTSGCDNNPSNLWGYRMTNAAAYARMTFNLATLPGTARLEIEHLSASDLGQPLGGYSPVDIVVNGDTTCPVATRLTPGSHGGVVDSIALLSSLQAGDNTIEIKANGLLSEYWIRRMSVLSDSVSIPAKAASLAYAAFNSGGSISSTGCTVTATGCDNNASGLWGWRMLSAASEIQVAFNLSSAPDGMVLYLEHLAETNAASPKSGYSPIDILVNGEASTPVTLGFTPGSHTGAVDKINIGSHLSAGSNTVTLKAGALDSLYWIRTLSLVVNSHSSFVPLGDALDAPTLLWTTGGDSVWLGQTLTSFDGVSAAESGLIGDGEQTWLETSVTGPGRLTYRWKVSSESGYDYLRFYLDGAARVDITGEQAWGLRTFDLTTGSHTLTWKYLKDGSASDGSDCGWVDQVIWTPSGGLWAGASDAGGGWKWLAWFGYFKDYGAGWIYHAEHGWLYAVGTTTADIWFWAPRLSQWLWTSSSVYPFLWNSPAAAWWYYYVGTGTGSGGWFRNYANGLNEWH